MARRLKPDERFAITDWDGFRKGLLQATTVDETEDYPDKVKRVASLEADPEAWFAYYFPNYCTAKPAKFHTKATRRLLANNRWYEVRAWSRELAKSARSMMEVLYLALTRQVNNVLLISNSQDNAERLLMPLMINLESNQRIIADYGNQQKPGSWEIGEFTTTGGVAFRALGAGQSPRGTRNEAARPDFILVDDIDTDEETRNPERIQKKWEWIEQALIPTVSVSGNYRILFNGNIIARDCCITRAIQKADCVDVINIRDKNGKSTWPEKNSEPDIDKILSLISEASSQKEYFNNPVNTGDVFKEMTWGKVPPLSKFPFLVAYGDPAPANPGSKNKPGANKALFLIGRHEGKVYIITGFLEKVANSAYVGWYYNLRNYVSDRTQVYYYIENNSLQDPFFEQVFIPLFKAASDQHGAQIPIIGDDRKKPDKFARIEGNLEPLNRLGNLILNEAEKGNPNMVRLEEQFKLVNAQLKAPADGPDCVEGAVWIINQKLAAFSVGSFKVGSKPTNKKRY